MTDTPQSSFEGWAVLEIFGHQRYAGYVTTQAFGQAVLFRVDVPPLPERERTAKYYEHADDGTSIPPGSTVKEIAVQAYTKFFGPGAIYAMTPCSQEAAEKAVASMTSRKVSIVSLAPEARVALPGRQENDSDDARADDYGGADGQDGEDDDPDDDPEDRHEDVL